jgi:hypothetical protein
MFYRCQIYSICGLIAIGSLCASEVSLGLRNQRKTEEPKCCKVETATDATPILFLQPCPDAWRFSADFLYFMPTVDDTYFAINSPIEGDFTLRGPRINDNFGFHPGFRVGAEYAFCQTHRDIQVFYTYLHAEESSAITGDHLWATLGSTSFSTPFTAYTGSASSKLKLLYQRLDFNVSQHLIDAHGFNFYAQPGLEYAYLRLQQRYRFEIPDFLGTVYQQSRGWGLGPQLGLGFDSNLCQGSLGSACSTTHGLTVSSLFSASLLTGQGRTLEVDIRDGDCTNDVKDKLAWRMIPALHARVGLAYIFHAPCMGASLSVGYEFNTYIRGLAKATYPSTTSTSNAVTNYYNFDVQGLDISIAITF